MAMTLHARTRILLSAAMAAGLAALPPDLTAQAGSGEPGRSLGAWMLQARENPFHGSTRTGTPENPTVAPGVGLGMADTHYMFWRLPQVPDSAVSRGRVFAFTLAGATIPLIPAMVSAGLWEWGTRTVYLEGLLSFAVFLGGLATLVAVPVAAGAGGVDSPPRTLAGTVLGFGAGLAAAGVTEPFLPHDDFWGIPVFSVTMASVTTLITTW
ncbi:MAG: hypothetical protein OXQ94_08980 [Gemmatimonadota bacterium]|nr:hypothetical protein [Gemmatimonadota bacterium]MDE2871804.1 hypothetical protein [Gemmatimonadota bacterium]